MMKHTSIGIVYLLLLMSLQSFAQTDSIPFFKGAVKGWGTSFKNLGNVELYKEAAMEHSGIDINNLLQRD